MAASSTKNRLSSLFCLSRDESLSNLASQSCPSLPHQESAQGVTPSRSQSPSRRKLLKLRASSSSRERPQTEHSLSPLEPPSRLRDIAAERPSSREGTSSRASNRFESGDSSREASRSRSQTPLYLTPPVGSGLISRPSSADSTSGSKRRSWLGAKQSAHENETEMKTTLESRAWIAGLKEHVPYDLTPLLNGARVQDLWNEQGDTYIYLFPQTSGKGPSFKLDSQLFAASRSLLLRCENADSTDGLLSRHSLDSRSFNSYSGDTFSQVHERTYAGNNQRNSWYNNTSKVPVPDQHTESHLHVPIQFDGDFSWPNTQPTGDDFELMILYRNFFAFLSGGALVATPRQITLYPIFIGITSILKRYNFTNADGSTYGDVAASSFSRYCEELRLADVRASREKTLEAIILGERMRYWPLYNEGFVHAAGRLDELKSTKSRKFAQISPVTANRLERATIDIKSRLLTVRSKLEDFDFPSMFAGIANSQTSTESKLVRFKEWKLAFTTFRRHTVAHYRQKYGSWPPKANSKKHTFEESGLNRILLQTLYQDFTELYDMLVDRSSMTTRTMDLLPLSDDDVFNDVNESIHHAIRRIESENDRSTPPVCPPIPFDVPLLPSFTQSFNRAHVDLLVSTARATKRLKENEVNGLLLGSYNRESMKPTQWLQDFIAFERRMGTGKTLDELIDMRIGQWLFVYAVLQSLPMTVIDARDLKFTDGVEYFLCIPSRGGKPWMKEDTSNSRSWYNVASGGGVVSLPADVVDHSVEGIYRRSHCWTIAAEWTQNPVDIPIDEEEQRGRSPPSFAHPMSGESPSSLAPPVSSFASSYQRDNSPVPLNVHSHSRQSSSRSQGMDEVAPPAEMGRPVSSYNPNTTFDSILGIETRPQKKGKKGANKAASG